MFRRAINAARCARVPALRRILAKHEVSAVEEAGGLSSFGASASGRSIDGYGRRFISSTAATSNALYGSMLVERIPVVIPEAPEWEREYKEWSQARRDKFKVKLPDQIVEAKGLLENLPDFEPASRETEADQTGDRSTIHRKLAEFLFLVSRTRMETGDFRNVSTVREKRCVKLRNVH